MAHVGIDSIECPSEADLALLMEETNLEWIGFYLSPTSTHIYPGWMTGSQSRLYQILKNMGWGVVPIYMGQNYSLEQKLPGGSSDPTKGEEIKGRILTAKQGYADGKDAALLAMKAGFPKLTNIYLDIEQGPGLWVYHGEVPIITYFKAWVRAIFESGYWPGCYCNPAIAGDLVMAAPQTRIWATRPSLGTHKTFDDPCPTPEPSQSGYAAATVWQFAWNSYIRTDVGERSQGVKTTLPKRTWVDLNSSTSADPSHDYLKFNLGI